MSGPQATDETLSHLDLAVCLGLILSIITIYAQVFRFDFIHLDDSTYVSGNVHVQQGLTPASIRWAFTAVADGNWIPVTMLSHVIDGELFGLRSGMHHLANVFYHMLAALLLYLTLLRATRARAPSAFVAFGFALHPLHVESVAWISERKDVLSALFFFLALYCYVVYTERPSPVRYLAVLGAFCLSLMSKPMLVTFPFVLLLFDVWPLGRLEWPNPRLRIVWEKLPFLAVSAASSVIAYLVQSSAGAVGAQPLAIRIGNAAISYVIYLRQTFWPTRLAVFYSYPQSIIVWQVVAALAFLLAVTAGVILSWRRHPSTAAYLTTGWFWYLGTLVPVIGLVQIGQQSHADRYTYIPMTGIFIMLAWGAADILKTWPRSQPAMSVAAVVFVFGSVALASRQTGYWRNSELLFQHTIDSTRGNWETECVLGVYLTGRPGRRADALEHFEAALRIKPDCAQANNGIGWCLMAAGLYGAALPHLEAALRAMPDSPDINNNLGQCLMASERYSDAIPYFKAALKGKPEDPDTLAFLAQTLEKIPGRSLEAAEIHDRLAKLLVRRGRGDAALAHAQAAQNLRGPH